MKYHKDKAIINEYLKKYPFQQYFSFDITPYLSIAQCEAEELIFNDGNSPQYLYYLVKGSAKVYLSPFGGKISLANFINAPSFIGEVEFIEVRKFARAVHALFPCTLFALQLRECKQKLFSDAHFLRCLCTEICSRALEESSHYNKNQSFPLENRLASFILLTATNSVYNQKHTEASEYLGVSYRHLLYCMAGFVKQKLLSKESCGYRIIDRDGLTRLAVVIDTLPLQ